MRAEHIGCITVHGMQIHGHQGKIDVVGLSYRATWPVLIDIADLEIFIVPADLATITLFTDFFHEAPSRDRNFAFLPTFARLSGQS